MRPFLKEWAGVGSKKKREVARNKLLLVLVHWSLLVGCKQLIFIFILSNLNAKTNLYGLAEKCCRKGFRRGLPPILDPLQGISFFLKTNKACFATFCADGAPGVPDELPLGHLVLHMGRAQVHGEQDQGEAHHVSDQAG